MVFQYKDWEGKVNFYFYFYLLREREIDYVRVGVRVGDYSTSLTFNHQRVKVGKLAIIKY